MMKRCVVHLSRLAVVCCVMVLGFVFGSPALAQPVGELLGQPSISMLATSVGSAKDLLGQEGKPIYKNLEPVVSSPVTGVERLKQVVDSINKSFDRKQVYEKPDRIQVEIKLPSSSKPRNIKKDRLPVSDR